MENIFFIISFLVLIARPFTVLFHELGHAIPAILLTKEKVSIYIGSYGDPAKSINFNIGLLEVWFRYNPVSWRVGLCVPTARSISINRQIIYILCGPFASVVIAGLACYLAFSFDVHDTARFYSVVFFCSAAYDLFVNLTPRSTPIKLYDGTVTYNDGYYLKQLFRYKRFPKEYELAAELYTLKKYQEAAECFTRILAGGIKDENIYKLAISAHIQERNYNQAKDLLDDFLIFGKMNADDLANAGLVYSKLDLHHKAIEFYDKSLQQDPNNRYSLNNKGYTLNLLSRYEEAIPFFDRAIEIDKTYAYSYNNRGLAKIKLGNEKDGLADIHESFSLDKDNSYAYRNLGIYHFDRGEYDEALKLFVKAKEMDNDTHMIEELIATVTENLKEGKI